MLIVLLGFVGITVIYIVFFGIPRARNDAQQVRNFLSAGEYGKADEILDRYLDTDNPMAEFCLMKADSLVAQEQYWEL